MDNVLQVCAHTPCLHVTFHHPFYSSDLGFYDFERQAAHDALYRRGHALQSTVRNISLTRNACIESSTDRPRVKIFLVSTQWHFFLIPYSRMLAILDTFQTGYQETVAECGG